MRKSTSEQPALGYDYQRQAWVERYGTRGDGAWLWRVQPCNHPDWMRPSCCYAGSHAGEIVVHHEEIHG